MSEEDTSINKLIEPFSELARKTRKNLLVSSVIGIAIVKVGLLPEKINAFGIVFNKTNQSSLLVLIALIILYFLVSFIIYIFSEMTAWNLKYRVQELERLKNGEEIIQLNKDGFNYLTNFIGRYKKTTSISKILFNIRMFIEVGVPLCVSIYGISVIYISVN